MLSAVRHAVLKLVRTCRYMGPVMRPTKRRGPNPRTLTRYSPAALEVRPGCAGVRNAAGRGPKRRPADAAGAVRPGCAWGLAEMGKALKRRPCACCAQRGLMRKTFQDSDVTGLFPSVTAWVLSAFDPPQPAKATADVGT